MNRPQQKGNWTEIEIESTDSDAVDLNTIELELNSEEDTSGKEQKRSWDRNASQTDKKNEDKEDFSEGIEDKGKGAKAQEETGEGEVDDSNLKPNRAYKRIKSLLARNQEKDAIIQEKDALIQELSKKAKIFERQNITSQKSQWEKAVEMKEQQLEKAMIDNDPKEVAKATKELADAQMRYSAMSAVEEDFDDTPNQVPPTRTQQQASAPPEAAKDWIKRNPWFFKDEKKHVLARMISAELTKEGEFDPESDEYWDELDSRLNKFGIGSQQKEQSQQQQQTRERRKGSPVGASRSNDEDFEAPVRDSQFSRQGNKVSATPSKDDVEMAERLGVPLNDFMKEKFKYSSQGYKGYVTIDVP